MSIHRKTIATYDRVAQNFAAHFQSYDNGAVRRTISRAFQLAGSPAKPRVVEVGCGAGKDAPAIIKIAGWYEGFDPSIKLLEIARASVPGGRFIQADAVSYDYPVELDMVFAFASMLHLNKNDFATACHNIAAALKSGGVLCMMLKEADEYVEQLQEDEFGERLFYLYSPSMARELAGKAFEQVYESHEVVGVKQKPWFTCILRKT